jgi:hypothetical protein
VAGIDPRRARGLGKVARIASKAHRPTLTVAARPACALGAVFMLWSGVIIIFNVHVRKPVP